MERLASYIQKTIAVNDEELNLVLSYFHKVEARKGEILVFDGEVDQSMYFVVDGCLRIYFIKEDGQDVTRYLAFENQFATALVSFIQSTPSLEFVEALEKSVLCVISRHDFFVLLDTIPQWETFYRKYLEIAYVSNTNRLMSFITMDASERYTLLLEQSPMIVRRLPNKLVANYLNISQETLSRLKSKLFNSDE